LREDFQKEYQDPSDLDNLKIEVITFDDEEFNYRGSNDDELAENKDTNTSDQEEHKTPQS
jgi:hypothetical protein